MGKDNGKRLKAKRRNRKERLHADSMKGRLKQTEVVNNGYRKNKG